MDTRQKLSQVTYRVSDAGIALDNGDHEAAIEQVKEAINYAESVLSDLTHPHSFTGEPS